MTPQIEVFLDSYDDSLVESVAFFENSNSEQLRKNIIAAITASFGSNPTPTKDEYYNDILVWKSVAKGIRGEMKFTGRSQILYQIERLQ